MPRFKHALSGGRGWGVAAAVLLVALLAGAAYAFSGMSSATRRVERTGDVALALSRFQRSLADAETSQRGYLATGDPRFLDVNERGRLDWSVELDRAARNVTGDDPRQQERLARLRDLATRKVAEMQATREAFEHGRRGPELTAIMLQGKELMSAIRGEVADAQREEEALAVRQQAARQTHARWAAILLVASALLFTGVVAFLWLQRLRAERARALAAVVEREQTKMSTIVQSAADGILFLDVKTGALLANRAFEELVGRPLDPHAGVAQEVGIIHGPDGRVVPESEFPSMRALRTRERVRQELVFVHADGRRIPVEEHASPVQTADGTVVGVVVTCRDLTPRDELERARAELERLNRMKDEFLAMLGHELRNPLSPITTAVHLLRSRRVEARELDVIERQARHLTSLVDDLLDMSRITRGQLTLHLAPVELADVVESAVEMTRAAVDDREQALVVQVPARGLVVDGDAVRLAQVVSNLLANAAKYTPRGGRIVVQAESQGAEVVLRVQDTGEGIDPELLPHVFDMFVQSRQSLARSQGGLGLGLTIVKNLVAMHQGTVEAHSDGPGRGSTFTVRLPAAAATAAAATAPGEPAAPPATGEPRERRVLIVDDNQDSAELLAEAVGALGYATATAGDGAHALEIAAQFAPQFALLDLGLPVMDGYELAARLRERDHDVTLFAITGYGQESDRRRTAAAGFDVHLTKPVDLDELRRLLER